MNFGEMIKLLSINTDINNGKHLFGTLINNGSLVVIGLIAVLAIVTAIVIFLRKKKKDNEEKDENK